GLAGREPARPLQPFPNHRRLGGAGIALQEFLIDPPRLVGPMEVRAVDFADGEQSVARERAPGKLGDQELVGLDGRQVIAVVRELPSYFAVELGGIRQRSRTRAVGWVKAIHGLESLDQL